MATPLVGRERRQSSSTGSVCAHDPIIGFVLDEAHINTDPVTGNIAVTQVYGGNFNGSVNQDPSVSYSSSPDALNFQGNTSTGTGEWRRTVLSSFSFLTPLLKG